MVQASRSHLLKLAFYLKKSIIYNVPISIMWFFLITCAYFMSASIADLSIPLTVWGAEKAALLTLLHSSIFGGYPSVPAIAANETDM